MNNFSQNLPDPSFRPVIVFLGPQGSGKGTQARILSDRLALPLFEMGQVIRQRAKLTDRLGQRIKKIHDQGDLIGPSDSQTIFEQGLKLIKPVKGLIIDGFPRNDFQIELFDRALERYQFNFVGIIVIELSVQESLRRLSSRRQCQNCGHISRSNQRKCSNCQRILIVRSDETSQSIKKRLENYLHETVPVIDRLDEKFSLKHVDGRPDIKSVSQAIWSSLVEMEPRFSDLNR